MDCAELSQDKVVLARTRCKYVHVSSAAASLRPTVLENNHLSLPTAWSIEELNASILA